MQLLYYATAVRRPRACYKRAYEYHPQSLCWRHAPCPRPHGHPGSRRNHRRRTAARPAHARLRQRRLRQDAVRGGVPRARRTQFDEPGVFMAFEETAEELAQNVARSGSISTTWSSARSSSSTTSASSAVKSRDRRIRPGRAVRPAGSRDRLDRRQAGRAGHARGAVRRPAQRRILRAELRRLFRWLKDKGVTAVITAERGEGS